MPPSIPAAHKELAHSVAAHCGELLQPDGMQATSGYIYGSLAFCVLDAVWSPNARFGAVQGVLSRYAASAGLPDPFAPAVSDKSFASEPQPLSAFLALIDSAGGAEAFAMDVLANRQRTSSGTSGILKADAARRFAIALRQHGIETPADVRARPADPPPAFEAEVRAIPGQASGVSLRTFYRLCGATHLAKPGQSVVRVVEAATGQRLKPEEAWAVLEGAAALLAADAPGLTVGSLEAALWWRQRASLTPGPSPGAAGEGSLISQPAAKPVKPVEPTPAEASPDIGLPSPAAPGEGPGVRELPPKTVVRYDPRIREIPADERPRERLIRYGSDVLSVTELLAILLRTGTEKMSAVGLANALLSEHGGLRGVAAMTVEQMANVHGIGPPNPTG